MSSAYLSSLYDVIASPTGVGNISSVAATTLQALSTAQANVNTAGTGLVGVASVNLNARLADATTLSTRAGALTTLNGALQTFSSVLSALTDTTQTAGITGSSSSSAVTVAVGAHAAPSTTTVNVDQLAQAQVNVSADAADATSSANFGTGSLTIQEGGRASIEIQLNNAMSLDDIANAINGAGANVTASVVQDGASFRLQVTGNDTGAANEVTFTEVGTQLGLAANQTQQAQDLTGSANGTAFSSATNVVSNVVPGASLVANATVTGATITLGADATSAVAGVQAFVSAYNTALTALNTAQAGNSDVGVLDSLRQQLARFAGEVTPAGQGGYSALAQLGVSTNADGTLVVDASKLGQAASADPLGVASVLSGNNYGQNGVAADLQRAVLSFAQPATGILAQNGYGLQVQAAQNGAAILRDSEYVQDITSMVATDIATYQRRLAEMTADALLVPLLPTS